MACSLIVICRLLRQITRGGKVLQWELTTVCVSFIWFLFTRITGGQTWCIPCVLRRWISGIWFLIIISYVQIRIAKMSIGYNWKRNVIALAAIFTLLIAVKWKKKNTPFWKCKWRELTTSLLNGLDCSLNQRQGNRKVDLWESCLSPSVLQNAGPEGKVSHIFLHVLSHTE